MSNTVLLKPELLAALAIIPEASRTVQLRRHPLTLYPIEASAVALWWFEDPEMAVVTAGVHLDGGREATAKEIETARDNLDVRLASKIILASSRAPELEPLIPNLTQTERSRLVNNAMLLTTGGDVAGFFADVKSELEMLAAFATAQKSVPIAPPPKASPSMTGTRSSSSSKPRKRSRSR